MKDLFSAGSQSYQLSRPSYPQAVLQEILRHVEQRELAWDCGAGSGQFTQLLAPYFDQVVATDLSAQQLQYAPQFDNVSYQVQPAEQTSFMPQSFDLISVAQAIHWFDFDQFYAEVERCLKPNGVLAIVGYGLIHVHHPEVSVLLQHLYHERLHGYWAPERVYVDECYQTLPFPFVEIESPVLKMQYLWSAQQLLDYLSTWTAVRQYRQQQHLNPLAELEGFIAHQQIQFQVEFPILLRLGRKPSHNRGH